MDEIEEFMNRFLSPRSEPSSLELSLANAISHNSPYQVFAALDAIVLVLSYRPLC